MKPTVTNLVSIVVAVIGVLAGGWTYLSTKEKIAANMDVRQIELALGRVEHLEERIDLLEKEVDVLKEERLKLLANIAELEFQKKLLQEQQSFDHDQAETFNAVLKWMPYPAWIKRAELVDGEYKLTMILINRAYEDMFEITSNRYVGRTDFEVWTYGAAKDFYNQDIRVLSTKSRDCEKQEFPASALATPAPGLVANTIKKTICKWYVPLENGEEAVAGIVVETDL